MDGPDEYLQNRPEQLTKAIGMGFHVEIDVWYIDSKWMSGHDGPEHEVSWSFLVDNSDKLWVHCKNLQAFFKLKSDSYHLLNYFWHESDAVVLTSHNHVWTYFGKLETMHSSSICVMPEVTYEWNEIIEMTQQNKWHAVCTDWARKLKECLE
jgi:hypothetical protein